MIEAIILYALVEIRLMESDHWNAKAIKTLSEKTYEIPADEVIRYDGGKYYSNANLEYALKQRGAFSKPLPKNQRYFFCLPRDRNNLKLDPVNFCCA